MDIEKLKESNVALAETIRAGEGSDEDLREFFEAYEENREIIEKFEASLN